MQTLLMYLFYQCQFLQKHHLYHNVAYLYHLYEHFPENIVVVKFIFIKNDLMSIYNIIKSQYCF